MLEAAIDFLDTCMCLIQMDVQRHIDRCTCLYNSLNFSELNEDVDVLMMEEELRQMYSKSLTAVCERTVGVAWLNIIRIEGIVYGRRYSIVAYLS
jgi:hypothetical protein